MQSLESSSMSAEDQKNSLALEKMNNHVHSNYSFSPYAPSEIINKAIQFKLKAVGLMDHDTVAGAYEFIEAGKKSEIHTTVGCEVRAHFSNTAMKKKRLNNPDEKDIAYIALHGIPYSSLQQADEFLRPIREARFNRTNEEVLKLNQVLSERKINIALDMKKEVAVLSRYQEGGTITERHVLYALSIKLINTHSKGLELVSLIEDQLHIEIPSDIRDLLLDSSNPFYTYDLLGLLKSSLVPRFFIHSNQIECPQVETILSFGEYIGAIPCYAYLGNVNASPTGDKKPQTFEDSFLEELIKEISRLGFKAVTYMPPRNSLLQIMRLQELCIKNTLMQISGVDINSPRQSFDCSFLLNPEFKNLIDATWALIAHEKLSSSNKLFGLFHPNNPISSLSLNHKIKKYAQVGQKLDPFNPCTAKESL